MTPSIFRRYTLCLLEKCPFKFCDDDTGCWGECIHCGKRAGFVDRATLRRYADREYERWAGVSPPQGTSNDA